MAACSTVIFMSLYKSEDFAGRLNFKIAPQLDFQIIAVIGIIVNFIFCYVWEVRPSHAHQSGHNINLLSLDLFSRLSFIPKSSALVQGKNQGPQPGV